MEDLTLNLWNLILSSDSIKIELNYRTLSWCPENCLLVVWEPAPCYTHTLKLDPRYQKKPALRYFFMMPTMILKQ